MPFVNSLVTKKIDYNTKNRLKVHIGDLINGFPGKSEEWLMVHFQDDEVIYFKGEKQEDAAVIDVKILGNLEIRYKDIFTNKVSEIFEQELKIPKNNIYVIFEEIPEGSWGWNGELF